MQRLRLLFVVFLFIYTPLQATTVTLQLPWKHQLEYMGFYAAIEQGYYKDEGIDLKIKEIDPKRENSEIELVLQKEVDFAISYPDIIYDYLDGKDLLFVANFFKRSPLTIFTKQDILLPSDLKEKTLLTAPQEGEYTLKNSSFYAMFSRYGVKDRDIIFEKRLFHIDSFIEGKVDAITGFYTVIPYILEKHEVPYNTLDPSRYGPLLPGVNLVSSQSFVKANPKLTKAFYEATIKGYKYAIQHKRQMIELVRTYSKHLSKAHMEFQFDQITKLIQADIYPIGSIDPKVVKNVAQYYSGVKKPKDDISGFLYPPATAFYENIWDISSLQKKWLLGISSGILIVLALFFLRLKVLSLRSAALEEHNKQIALQVEKEVNKRMQAETQSREYEKMAMLNSKLSSMGETVHMIAHQWRQPLASLGGMLNEFDIIFNYGKKADYTRKREIVKQAQMTLKHLSQTIDLFQNYLKPTDDKAKEFFVISTQMKKALDMNKGVLKNYGITIKTNCDKTLEVYGDKQAFIHVVMNILANAKDVFLSRDTKNPLISISLHKKNNNIILTIADNGGGITMEPVEKIFEPYMSDKEGSGSGIGLFIAKQIIVKNFEGSLEAYNDANGAVFSIKL